MIKSINYDQSEILNNIKSLHCNDNFHCDITYGNGSFYKNIERPSICLDLDPLFDHVIKADSRELPIKDNSLNNIIFDPPFLTYIKNKRDHNSIMGKRFSGYWRYDELEDHYKKTILESKRVLVKKGVMIFKCQDIIHNHKMHCTHNSVIEWSKEAGFRLKDMFILIAKNRMPVKASVTVVQIQKHARIYHSYFLIFEKTGR